MFAQQLQALNIHVDEDTVEENGITVRPNTTKSIEAMSAIQADAEAIVQALEVTNRICFFHGSLIFYVMSFL